MAQTKLNMLLQMRRDDVFTSTYVLQAGEPGFELSTKIFKVGDGSTTWENLPFANRAQIEALIKVVDDKVAALDDTYATDEEVRLIKEALEAAIALKLDKTTYDSYVEAHKNDYTNTEIDAKFNPYRTSADQDAIDATFALKATVEAEFAKYTTTTDQQAIDAEQDRRIGVLEAKPFDTYATKTEVQGVASDLSEYETANDARVKAIEDEIDGFNYADATETTNALNDRYTKAEADAAFTTPAEVIAEVNKALSEVSSADTIENISTLVNYVNENAADLTGLITEVYGSAEMTGDSRLDTIEAKAAMGITIDDIAAWNAEKGVKEIVDANKLTWDLAGTALQAADLADYAKTADVVTNDEFTAFEATNTEAIGKKLDKSVYDAYIAGKELSDAELKKYAEDEADAAESAAKAYTDEKTMGYEYSKNPDGFESDITITANGIIQLRPDSTYGVTINGDKVATEDYVDEKTAGYRYFDNPDNGGEITIEANEVAINAANDLSLEASNINLTGSVWIGEEEAATKSYVDGKTLGYFVDEEYGVVGIESMDVELRANNQINFVSDLVTIDGKDIATQEYVDTKVGELDVGVTKVTAGTDIVVTPEAGTGNVTVSHATFTTGEYTKDPSSSDKTGDVYMMTSVSVDNGHVTGANVKSLAAALEGMTFIFDGGSSSN